MIIFQSRLIQLNSRKLFLTFLQNMIQKQIDPTIGTHKSISLLLSAPIFADELLPQLNTSFEVHAESNIEALDTYLKDQSLFSLPDVILLEVDKAGECFDYIEKLKK